MKNKLLTPKCCFSSLITFTLFIVTILMFSPVNAQPAGSSSGWYFTNYSFKDGSLKNSTVLMGTSSKMNNVISYTGAKGNMTITQNRYDDKTGKLLAGVTYTIVWSDPSKVLIANEKSSLNFTLKTIASKTWAPPQSSVYFNQGIYGVYFLTPDGKKYFTKDISTTLTTEKVIEKGSKGVKKFIQVNLGNGYMFTYNYEWRDGIASIQTEKPKVSENENAWHFTSYSFKDGSLKNSTVLMGTSSKMNNVISYTGAKGNMTITQNRYDDKTGKLLAGVTYNIVWSDPSKVLIAKEKSSLNFTLKIISSKTWAPPQNSVYFNQGIYGVYFLTPDGKKYFNYNISTTLTTEKVIAEGSKGAKKIIQVNLGNGYMFTYNYEWR